MTREEMSRDIKEIEEIISCDADVEVKYKMIFNVIYSRPHYFKIPEEEQLEKEKLKAELEYAKFQCALPTIMNMMKGG